MTHRNGLGAARCIWCKLGRQSWTNDTSFTCNCLPLTTLFTKCYL